MSRLEKFRAARRFRRRYASLFFLFLFIIIFGLCVVDYSTNWLIKNQKSIQIVGLTIEDTIIKIRLLDKTFTINASIVINDLSRLKQRIIG